MFKVTDECAEGKEVWILRSRKVAEPSVGQ